jgi:putative spermidine/putrescine transport system permease protein
LARRRCPSSFPGLVAGSIFTFSLTLGDYIIPGGPRELEPTSSGRRSSRTRGRRATSRSRRPSRVVPMVLMAIYLTIARKLGAFEAL